MVDISGVFLNMISDFSVNFFGGGGVAACSTTANFKISATEIGEGGWGSNPDSSSISTGSSLEFSTSKLSKMPFDTASGL